MEDKVILQISIKDGELVVEGGGDANFPPLVLVGLIEKVKLDILRDIDSQHQPATNRQTYEA